MLAAVPLDIAGCRAIVIAGCCAIIIAKQFSEAIRYCWPPCHYYIAGRRAIRYCRPPYQIVIAGRHTIVIASYIALPFPSQRPRSFLALQFIALPFLKQQVIVPPFRSLASYCPPFLRFSSYILHFA